MASSQKMSSVLRTDKQILQPTLYVEYQTPLKGLSTRFQYTFGASQGNYDRFQYTYKTYTYNETTELYDITGGLSTGSHARNSTMSFSNTYQAQANYSGSFGPHNIAATYVFEARNSETPVIFSKFQTIK